MVDQQDENNGNRMTNESLPTYGHGGPLNPVSINGVNSGGENDQEIDESRSSTSPAEHMEGDEENMSESTNLIPEQDRFLPIANIGRIMKRAVPSHGKIAKEAKECVQECVSEFISFLTSEASDKCLHEKRKTITVEDMINAMRTLDLDEYADVLTVYMKRFREAHRGRGDQLSSPGVFGDTSTDDLQDSIQNEASSSTANGNNGVGETYQSVTIPATNGTEPVVRVLPANAQVLLDASGNHYLTWQGPEGTQIVQVQAASTIETSAVPLVRNEVAFMSSEPSSTIVNQGISTTVESNNIQGRAYRQPQHFRPVAQQVLNEVSQGQRPVPQNVVNTSTNSSTARFARPAAAANTAVPVKRSRDGKTQFLRT